MRNTYLLNWKNLFTDLIAEPGLKPHILRHLTLLAGGVSCAHIDWFLFNGLNEYPSKLGEGDIEANLRELAAPATEEVSERDKGGSTPAPTARWCSLRDEAREAQAAEG